MVSADMCEHDWPGSGCSECREKYGWPAPKPKVSTPPPPAVDWERRVALDAAQIDTLSARLTAALARAEKAEARVKELETRLRPFANAASAVPQSTGFVTVTTCAEYFHEAAATLSTEGGDRG